MLAIPWRRRNVMGWGSWLSILRTLEVIVASPPIEVERIAARISP